MDQSKDGTEAAKKNIPQEEQGVMAKSEAKPKKVKFEDDLNPDIDMEEGMEKLALDDVKMEEGDEEASNAKEEKVVKVKTERFD